MIGKLIERPIAVTMTIIAIIIVGVVGIGMLPVSLMPEIDIPQVTVQVSAPGSSAREVDDIMSPLVNELKQISSVNDIKSEANNNFGNIYIEFKHGSVMDFLFVEVNEKIDKAISAMPREIERPRVIKASATDIPAFFMNMTIENATDESFLELSRFASDVISKRVEQITEVAIVDISGLLLPEIMITPDSYKMTAMGVTERQLENAISNNNLRLGNLSIKDGHYRWDVRFISEIRTVEDIENISLNIAGRVYKFKELASVVEQPRVAMGLVRSDGKNAVSLAIIKQSDAKMSKLQKSLDELIGIFNEEYPEIEFKVTRDQTALLDYSISNLRDNMIIGAILACLIIFLFMRDYRLPLLITITIPLSLVVSLLAFYLVGMSINIISLSGLILGLGLMVDNSIIVIDNIAQIRERGWSLKDATVKGVSEVFAAMLSSVLTTCSVFIPLIFLSGIAGALFYDQAMAISIALFSSLFVAVLVIPVYYYRIYKRETDLGKEKPLRISKYDAPKEKKKRKFDYESFYERGLKWVFRHQRFVWTLFILVIPATAVIYQFIEKSKLPPITHDDIMLHIDWNMPLSLEENDRRIAGVISIVDDHIQHRTAMVGIQQYLLPHTKENTQSESVIYLKANKADELALVEDKLSNNIRANYPDATFSISPSENIFNAIFSDEDYNLVVRIASRERTPPEPDKLNQFLNKISAAMPDIYMEPVLWQEQIMFVVQPDMLALYKLDYGIIYSAMRNATRESRLFSINHGTYSIPIMVGNEEDFSSNLISLTVKNSDGVDVPLSVLLKETRVRDLKQIVSGAEGSYYPLNITVPDRAVEDVMDAIRAIAHSDLDFDVSFSGSYFSNRDMIKELIVILLVALLLLFFILAAEFESLIQPLIILSEILVDLFGAMLVLHIFGSGLNLMSLIGLVVMSSIIINDSILKVDTINRLRKEGYPLLRAIFTGSSRRLKPIIMTSLSTILAIAPFLVRGDMGSDLQYPLSLAIIGGMVLGTIVSIYFIPIFYYRIYKRSEK